MPPVFIEDKFYCTECKWNRLYSTRLVINGCISPHVIEYKGIPAKYGVSSCISNVIPSSLETPIWCQYLQIELRKQKLKKIDEFKRQTRTSI